jgi:adenylylsulfate kinase-like enzyme
MRILITGASRSGKSTALHRLAKTAMAQQWLAVLLADGKAMELLSYARPDRIVYTEHTIEAFSQALAQLAQQLTQRYSALAASGQRSAAPDAPRTLLIVDEIQIFTRHPLHGKKIRDALTQLAEQSGALGDILILTSQRATGAVPPSVRVNIDTELRMLGAGYFQLIQTGQPKQQGRTDPSDPHLAQSLCPANLLSILGSQTEQLNRPTPITRYEGQSGSGLTHALLTHRDPSCSRRIMLDCRAHTHRSLLIDCLRQCGAEPAEGALITELAQAASLALAAQPTLLLLDNLDCSSLKARDSLHRLLDSAASAAISLQPPKADCKSDPLASLRRRASLIELRPLSDSEASQLIRRLAPQIDDASALAIVRRADGNPQALVAYAERVITHGEEERHQIESVRRPARWLNIVLMFGVIVVVILIQRNVSNDIAGGILTGIIVMLMWFLRPKFRQVTK